MDHVVPQVENHARATTKPAARNRRAASLGLAWLLTLGGTLAGCRAEPPDASPPAAAPARGHPESHGPDNPRPHPTRSATRGTLTGTLWSSPTNGPPLQLNWTPPETQVVVALRPRAALQLEEGRRVLRALGPDLDPWLQRWQQQFGIRPEQLEQWVVALCPADAGPPLVTHRLRLGEPAGLAPPTWSSWSEQPTPAGPLWTGPEQLAVLLPSQQPELMVVGPRAALLEMAELQGQPPLLLRPMQTLRQYSDADQHVSILLTPHFLFADGRHLWQGHLAPLQDPAKRLLDQSVPAALLSFHLDPYFFGQLRALGRPPRDAFHLAGDLAAQMAELPADVRQFVSRRLDPYWHELALAFPAMVTYLQQHLRVAVEDQQAVLNFALPTPAAHNLVLATELALATPAGATPPSQTTPAGDPLHLEQWLEAPISLEFPQLSLEAALEELQQMAAQQYPSAVPLPIEIRGQDLKEAGITRNQQIRAVRLQGRTVADVLTELVRRANPVRAAATDAPEQILVWVVAAPPDRDNQTSVLITTRAAAAARGWTLPAPFLSP